MRQQFFSEVTMKVVVVVSIEAPVSQPEVTIHLSQLAAAQFVYDKYVYEWHTYLAPLPVPVPQRPKDNQEELLEDFWTAVEEADEYRAHQISRHEVELPY
jgi:hypothetical protein